MGVILEDVRGGCWMNHECLSKRSETDSMHRGNDDDGGGGASVLMCVYQCRQAWRPGQSDAPS